MEQELKQGRQVINRGLLALYIKMSKALYIYSKTNSKNNSTNLYIPKHIVPKKLKTLTISLDSEAYLPKSSNEKSAFL